MSGFDGHRNTRWGGGGMGPTRLPISAPTPVATPSESEGLTHAPRDPLLTD
jgi:hypothetical protein